MATAAAVLDEASVNERAQRVADLRPFLPFGEDIGQLVQQEFIDLCATHRCVFAYERKHELSVEDFTQATGLNVPCR